MPIPILPFDAIYNAVPNVDVFVVVVKLAEVNEPVIDTLPPKLDVVFDITTFVVVLPTLILPNPSVVVDVELDIRIVELEN